GSFVWRVEDFLAEVKRQHPATYAALIEFAKLDHDSAAREDAFAAIHKTSVDYGVMEGAMRIGVVALSLHFDDIGTWDALADRDAMKSARTIEIHSRGCHAQSHGQVAFVGVEDLVVVVEEGRVLVAKRGQGQAVKKVSETLKLEKEGRSE
ncbi:MAG: hypothetical protein KDB07_04320, partial [Planctomycetes bacterium]|nr:hypothetical protein [Planctomycetota bacterium]